MQLNNKRILVAIIILTILALPGVMFGPVAIRIILGFPLITFLLGYALLLALIPQRSKLRGLERVVLSFGLSIAVVPLIGLILHYTPLGISLFAILISNAVFILVFSMIALHRCRKLPSSESFSITIRITPPNWEGMGGWDRVLHIGLALVALSLVGYLIYFIATPNQGERFTEYYILDAEGTAEGYPKQLVLGESMELILGIVNREYSDTSYSITITTNGVKNAEIAAGTLTNNQKWQEKVSLTPQSIGQGQKVEFWLYKSNETQPYTNEPLHLYIDVIAPSDPLAQVQLPYPE